MVLTGEKAGVAVIPSACDKLVKTTIVEKMDIIPGPGGDAETSKLMNNNDALVKSSPSNATDVAMQPDESPRKPTDVAMQPDEDAHSKVSSENNLDCDSKRDVESPLTVASGGASDIITDTVLEEESRLQKLDKEEEIKEEEELKKRKELWSHMDEETKEMRYKRLQLLLMKSNMYTEYLLKRMGAQKEDEKKRRERERKKLEKEEQLAEQRKEQGLSKDSKEDIKPVPAIKVEKMETDIHDTHPPDKSVLAETLQLKKISSPSGASSLASPVTRATRSNLVSPATQNVAENSQESDSSTPTRSRRSKSFLRAPVPKSKLSAANTPALSSQATPLQEESSPNMGISPQVGGASPKVGGDNTPVQNQATPIIKEEAVSPDGEKENKPSRRSLRTKSNVATPEIQDFEECIRSYLGEKLIPLPDQEISEGTQEGNEDPLYTTSKCGRKRKTNNYSEQSPPKDKILTHFFKPSAKRRKVDDDGSDSDSVMTEATSTAKSDDDGDDYDDDDDYHVGDEDYTGQSRKNDSRNKKPKDMSKFKNVTVSRKIIESPVLFEGEPEIEDDGTVVRPALFTGGTLRRYQVDGLNWLKILFENGVNGILADEMGLGKTIQVISLITQIVTMGATGPFMVVAPLSTLPNWKSEFKRFAPNLPVVFYHGLKEERGKIRNQMRKRHRIMENVVIQPVVITSYEMAMRDRSYLMGHEWTYMIVDEGHRLKNKNCRLIRELKLYKTSHRLLLTGTPLQNNLRELWSLLNFLLPEIFDDLGSFETWFDVGIISDVGADEAIIREEQKTNILCMLHQILTPFMLRRVKADVDLKIPPKKELLVYAPLTTFQQDFYDSTLDRTILQKIEAKYTQDEEEVEKSDAGRPKRWASKKKVNYSDMIESSKDIDIPQDKRKDEEELESWIESMWENAKPLEREKKAKKSQVTVRLQNIMMQLRKCCNHPYLLEYPIDPKTQDLKMDEDLVNSCGKMMILDKMLPQLKKRGHKVLIFSQMTKMLDILGDYFYIRKIPYCRLDGSCGVEDRQESMETFNTDPDMFVFLLSTRAGGLGINLVAADTVIIYDSDWNPQNDLQAQDRCHRIGQTRPVIVYRFVTANTIDQKIVERAAAKRKLEKMIIHKGKFKRGMRNFSTEVKPLSPEELMDLLKSRDYSSAVNQNKDVISKEDLDALLDRQDMIDDHERAQQGLESESVLRTTAAESSSFFKVVDYDQGGSTQTDKEQREATPSESGEATPEDTERREATPSESGKATPGDIEQREATPSESGKATPGDTEQREATPSESGKATPGDTEQREETTVQSEAS